MTQRGNTPCLHCPRQLVDDGRASTTVRRFTVLAGTAKCLLTSAVTAAPAKRETASSGLRVRLPHRRWRSAPCRCPASRPARARSYATEASGQTPFDTGADRTESRLPKRSPPRARPTRPMSTPHPIATSIARVRSAPAAARPVRPTKPEVTSSPSCLHSATAHLRPAVRKRHTDRTLPGWRWSRWRPRRPLRDLQWDRATAAQVGINGRLWPDAVPEPLKENR